MMQSITQFLSEMLSTSSGGVGIWQALVAVIIAYLGGVLSSLTPCVYPMIPITVSVIGGMGPNRKSWKEIYLRGLAYVGGMTLIYSFLGVIAGVSGKVFGTLTNHSIWYLGLGVVMTFAALIMLDVVPFDPVVGW